MFFWLKDVEIKLITFSIILLFWGVFSPSPPSWNEFKLQGKQARKTTERKEILQGEFKSNFNEIISGRILKMFRMKGGSLDCAGDDF